jgi:hypothetical protein
LIKTARFVRGGCICNGCVVVVPVQCGLISPHDVAVEPVQCGLISPHDVAVEPVQCGLFARNTELPEDGATRCRNM